MKEREARVSPVNSKEPKQTRQAVTLPQNALNPKNMLFLISREFRRHKRYKTPLSAVTVSIKDIIYRGENRKPTTKEVTELLPQLFNIIQPLLRDVDLAGTIILPELFLALPMTDEVGARTVRVRILEKVDRNTFTVAKQEVNLKVKITISLPSDTTKDLKTYIKEAMLEHYS